jgi:hypothetical protein
MNVPKDKFEILELRWDCNSVQKVNYRSQQVQPFTIFKKRPCPLALYKSLSSYANVQSFLYWFVDLTVNYTCIPV